MINFTNYITLSDKELQRQGLFMVESPLVAQRAIDAGIAVEAMICREGTEMPRFNSTATPPVYTASEEELRRYTGFGLTRGLLALCRLPEPKSIEEICRGARRIAVLHNIVDAVNVGTIFRSAAALGIDGILLTPSCCHPYNRRASRASMGNVFRVPAAFINDLAELRRYGFRTAAMALTADSITPDDAMLKAEERLAIILGNEGDGLPSEVVDASDYTVCIPMAAGVDSLNVATAAAIAFYAMK